MIELNLYSVIGISGKQYAGKDQLTDIILKHWPTFQKTPLALAIKTTYAQRQGITLEAIDRDKATHRPSLIEVGNWGRAQDPDYWLKQVLLLPGNKVISDVRMKREYETLRASGAFLIRINAARDIRAARGMIVNEFDRTECELDGIQDWDLILDNNESLEMLETNFLSALKRE